MGTEITSRASLAPVCEYALDQDIQCGVQLAVPIKYYHHVEKTESLDGFTRIPGSHVNFTVALAYEYLHDLSGAKQPDSDYTHRFLLAVPLSRKKTIPIAGLYGEFGKVTQGETKTPFQGGGLVGGLRGYALPVSDGWPGFNVFLEVNGRVGLTNQPEHKIKSLDAGAGALLGVEVPL